MISAGLIYIFHLKNHNFIVHQNTRFFPDYSIVCFRAFGQNMTLRFFMCSTQILSLFINLLSFFYKFEIVPKRRKRWLTEVTIARQKIVKKNLLCLCTCNFCNVLCVENKNMNCNSNFLYFLLFILFITSTGF